MQDLMFTSNGAEFNPLTREQLKAQVPYAFMDAPSNPNLSKNYVHIPTSQVVDDLEKLGWYAQEGKQRKARSGRSTIFTTHMIKFINPDLKIKGKDGDDSFPQIILTNSHDGMSSFRFQLGIYRLVCSNGLVVATDEFADFKIRHMGYSFAELQETIAKTVEELPNKLEIMDKMVSTDLTENQQREFALKAFLLRQGIKLDSEQAKEARPTEETIESILEAQREEDEGSNAWVVFNRIQEAITQGGFRGGLEGMKMRKVRKIKSFQKDTQLNKQLFQLATSYC